MASTAAVDSLTATPLGYLAFPEDLHGMPQVHRGPPLLYALIFAETFWASRKNYERSVQLLQGKQDSVGFPSGLEIKVVRVGVRFGSGATER